MNVTTAALLMPDARILIVDDQEANVAVLQAILTQAGYSSLTGMTDPFRNLEADEILWENAIAVAPRDAFPGTKGHTGCKTTNRGISDECD